MPRPGDLTEYLKVFSCINFLMNQHLHRPCSELVCARPGPDKRARSVIQAAGRGPNRRPAGRAGADERLDFGAMGGLVLV